MTNVLVIVIACLACTFIGREIGYREFANYIINKPEEVMEACQAVIYRQKRDKES